MTRAINEAEGTDIESASQLEKVLSESKSKTKREWMRKREVGCEMNVCEPKNLRKDASCTSPQPATLHHLSLAVPACS